MSGISNEQLLAQTDTDEELNGSQEQESAKLKFILLQLDNVNKYAIAAEKVKEIIMGQELYPLPFVPEWIPGLLNYHGDPCAVIDLNCILSGVRGQTRGKYVVLRPEAGNIALLVRNIDRIIKSGDQNLYPYPEQNSAAELFEAMIKDGEQDYPVVALDKIISRVKSSVDGQEFAQ